MSDKPSLYVVEKKEVIILVVLFVLVTVLSFTLGVRYGESVGKKQAHEMAEAAKEHGDAVVDAGGTLGKSGHVEPAKHSETGAEHGEAAHDGGHDAGKEEHPAEHGEAKAPSHGEEHKDESKAEHGGASPETGSHSPEAAAHTAAHSSPPSSSTHEVVDKNSDEYLLNALKDAGVEPPGGKAPKDAKLPESVKEAKRPQVPVPAKVKSGSYVIQVGSHPTRAEAEAQVRTLKTHKLSAEILAPFKDKQGEWHRVVLGSYKSKHDAEREAGAYKSKGSIVSYFVWRLP